MSLSLDEEPSFRLGRDQTSTPHKLQQGGRGGDADANSRDGEPLHESDTDSLVGDAEGRRQNWRSSLSEGGEEGYHAGGGGRSTPLTRRTLLQLAHHDDRPLSASARGLVDDHAAPLAERRTFDALKRELLYAPSPSTGSSTLVEREFDPPAPKQPHEDRFSSRPRSPLKMEEASSSRQEVRGHTSEDEASDIAAQTFGRRSRIGDLASFVDSRLAVQQDVISSVTPRRQSLRSSRSSTPRADTASPPSSSTARLSASTTREQDRSARTPDRFKTSMTAARHSNGSSQVHDVFKRLITGPDGALAHSAERRASSALGGSLNGSNAYGYEPPTPAPPGHYAFVPSSVLPLERSTPSRSRYAAGRQARRGEGQRREVEEEPSQLERALQHLGEAQRAEADGDVVTARPQQANVGRDPRVSLAQRDDDLLAGRSAIQFAMAESSAFSHSDEDAPPALPASSPSYSNEPRNSGLRNSVRFASEPTYRAQSPSRSLSPPSPPSPYQAPPDSTSPSFRERASFAGPGAFTRSRSPDLPPLPLPLPPDSPEPSRLATHGRSPSSRFRRSQTSPSEPPISTALDAPSAASPPRPSRRSGWERPASSTPPRTNGVEPPRPEGTPEDRPDLSLSTSRHSSSRPRRSRSPSVQGQSWPDPDEAEIPPLRFEPRADAAEKKPYPDKLSDEAAEDLTAPATADESTSSIKIRELVEQLSVAVQTLAEREVSPRSREVPRAVGELASHLARRKELDDARRSELERDLQTMQVKNAETVVSPSSRSRVSRPGLTVAAPLIAWPIRYPTATCRYV